MKALGLESGRGHKRAPREADLEEFISRKLALSRISDAKQSDFSQCLFSQPIAIFLTELHRKRHIVTRQSVTVMYT